MEQYLHPGNSGKATVILNYWKGGKKYSNKFKIVVRRYENPFCNIESRKSVCEKTIEKCTYRVFTTDNAYYLDD